MNSFQNRSRRTLLRIILPLIIGSAFVAIAPHTAEAAESDPQAIVRQTTDAVIAVLSNDKLNKAGKQKQIEQIVYEHFDFRTLSRLVLARNWQKLNPQQQEQFVEEFKRHLSLTYGRNVETYNQEKVVITGERQEPRGDRTVKTRIARPNAEDILVDYRLRKEDGTWRVIDVVIEGVSLVANYRSQFQGIISREGPAKLIQLLREKNEKGELFKAATGPKLPHTGSALEKNNA